MLFSDTCVCCCAPCNYHITAIRGMAYMEEQVKCKCMLIFVNWFRCSKHYMDASSRKGLYMVTITNQ